MIKFKPMQRLIDIPYVGIQYFNLGMITNVGQAVCNANEVLSLVLKFTSLISFGVFILLNMPRIKVRIAQIKRSRRKKKRGNAREVKKD